MDPPMLMMVDKTIFLSSAISEYDTFKKLILSEY